METAQSTGSASNSGNLHLSEPIQALSRPMDVGSFIKSQTTIQGYARPKITSNYENMDKPQRSFLDYGPLVDLYSNKTANSKYLGNLRKQTIYSAKNPNFN